MGLIIFLLLLNTGISFLNAYGAGAIYSESKAVGGWARVVNIASLVMAACGFSWVFMVLEAYLLGASGKLEPIQVQALFDLGYLIILLPILGSGMIIWSHSLIRAYKTRRLGDIAVAGWNTFAQVHNVASAARYAPGALKNVLGVFKGKDGWKLLLIVVALFGGIVITILIAAWADGKHEMDLDEVRKFY